MSIQILGDRQEDDEDLLVNQQQLWERQQKVFADPVPLSEILWHQVTLRGQKSWEFCPGGGGGVCARNGGTVPHP